MKVKYKSRVTGFLTIVFVFLVGFSKIAAQNYLTGPAITNVGASANYYLDDPYYNIMYEYIYWYSDGSIQGPVSAVYNANILWNSPDMHHWVSVYYRDEIADEWFEYLEVNVTAGTPTKITFDYDAAGNQTLRELCISCNKAGYKTTAPKEIAALQEEDLQKFSPDDVISYYPNPVREELYLKWELVADKTVTDIQLYDLNGRVLQNYGNLEKNNTLNIPFLNYPKGTYLVVLVYNDREQKTIKIVK